MDNKKEVVNHPPHYNQGKFEVIDVIEDWNLDFCLGNAVKYISRASHKGKLREDIMKAIWYLERKIGMTDKEKFELIVARIGGAEKCIELLQGTIVSKGVINEY